MSAPQWIPCIEGAGHKPHLWDRITVFSDHNKRISSLPKRKAHRSVNPITYFLLKGGIALTFRGGIKGKKVKKKKSG